MVSLELLEQGRDAVGARAEGGRAAGRDRYGDIDAGGYGSAERPSGHGGLGLSSEGEDYFGGGSRDHDGQAADKRHGTGGITGVGVSVGSNGNLHRQAVEGTPDAPLATPKTAESRCSVGSTP